MAQAMSRPNGVRFVLAPMTELAYATAEDSAQAIG